MQSPNAGDHWAVLNCSRQTPWAVSTESPEIPYWAILAGAMRESRPARATAGNLEEVWASTVLTWTRAGSSDSPSRRQFEQCAQQWHNLPHTVPSRFPAFQFQLTAGDTPLEPAGTAQETPRILGRPPICLTPVTDSHHATKVENRMVNWSGSAPFAPHGNVRMLLRLPLTPGSACNYVRVQQRPSLHPPFQLVFHFSTAKLYFPRTSHEPPAIPSSIRVGHDIDSSRSPHHTIGGDDAYGCCILVIVAFTSGMFVLCTE
ncbi:hypothetical protein CORC01_03390 [Colletotrichum orchidophilum]|uniref:Uncharacterized protein n=1 Tax=Colletotrichum orchidophilum TaxID=1209926 RepID=A0A1G4BJ92_9PEZI|nr:uncharacterized protein CORC01_03390 [Colletotrichum orchidophilum]OHF01357.1 hypothetical protein CORC01_03390 [Colletotrichum orchidophilum]